MLPAFWEVTKRSARSKGLVAGALILLLASATESRADCAKEVDAYAEKVYRSYTDAFGSKGQEPTLENAPIDNIFKDLFKVVNDALRQAIWLELRQELLPELVKQGQTDYDAGEYASALEKWQCVLELQRDIPQQFQGKEGLQSSLELQQQFRATIHSKIGTAYTHLANYPESLNHYQQALGMYHAIEDQAGEGKSLNSIGDVYLHLGRYPDALEHYQQALSTYRRVADRAGEGKSLNSIGDVYLHLGRYPDALEHYQQALSRYGAVQDQAGSGSVLSAIGDVYMHLGQYHRALDHYQQALAIHRVTGDRRGESDDLRNLATGYEALTEYPKALEYYQQALAIHRLLRDAKGESTSLTSLGDVAARLHEYHRAQVYYEQALALKRVIGDRQGEGVNLSHIGWVYAGLGQYERALPHLRDALAILTNLGASESLWQTQRRLAFVEAKLSHVDASLTHYHQAVHTIESVRAGLGDKSYKLSFIRDKLLVYDEFMTLLSRLHAHDRAQKYDYIALEIFERKQARVFLEEIGQSGARRFRGLPDAVTEEETRIAQTLSHFRTLLESERAKPERNLGLVQSWEAQLEALKAEQDLLERRLQTEHPDYHALKHPQPVTPSVLQNTVLQPRELMLIYSVMDEETLLWLVSPQAIRLFHIPVGERPLHEHINVLRRTMRASWGMHDVNRGVQRIEEPSHPRAFVEASHALYELLFPPEVRDVLRGHLVYLVPTGPLYGLPFEALVTGLTTEAQGVRYLVEDAPVAYVTSASLLKTLRDAARRQSDAPYPFLAFAHPIYDTESRKTLDRENLQALQHQVYRNFWGGSFKELPETEEEARAVVALFTPPPETDPLQLREAASRANVFRFNTSQRLADYQYVLFATHGVLPEEIDQVTQPALVLSYPENNGYLTMADVFSLRLNAKLVILSACNTGRGEQVRGEGVLGLTRAFMYAGTPAVAVTLWSVESLSAKTLSVGMFHALKALHNPAQALQAIKRCMIHGQEGENYQHPYYWAPFVMFGDAGAVNTSAVTVDTFQCRRDTQAPNK